MCSRICFLVLKCLLPCRAVPILNATSVPSQAFMLSGLLLPSIRIHATPRYFPHSRTAAPLQPFLLFLLKDINTFRHSNASSCSFASVHAQSIATSDECFRACPSFLSMCTSIGCCFRPFISVHAQWIAASVHSDSCIGWTVLIQISLATHATPQQIRDTFLNICSSFSESATHSNASNLDVPSRARSCHFLASWIAAPIQSSTTGS